MLPGGTGVDACRFEPCVARLNVTFPNCGQVAKESAMTPPREFEHIVVPDGLPTDTTLADVLGQRDEALDLEVQAQFDEIRHAETKAEKQTAEVRLY
jgi:hypothetical protein